MSEIIIERFAVCFTSKSKPHYVKKESVNETVCGKQIPAVPEEWSLVPDRKGFVWPSHGQVCKQCQRIMDKELAHGHIVRLTKKGEGRGEQSRRRFPRPEEAESNSQRLLRQRFHEESLDPDLFREDLFNQNMDDDGAPPIWL